MILSAMSLFRSLSLYHYRVILITILLPVIWSSPLAYFGTEHLIRQIIFHVAAFLVWAWFAVLAVGSMLRSDKSEAEQRVDHKIEALSGQTRRLTEELAELRAEFRHQAGDLEIVRSTLSEKLGVVFPPRPISMHATSGSPRASLNLTVVGGSKVARLRRWFRGAMRRLWEVVYGKPEDS